MGTGYSAGNALRPGPLWQVVAVAGGMTPPFQSREVVSEIPLDQMHGGPSSRDLGVRDSDAPVSEQ